MIVLASTSKYRRTLLQRLSLPFETCEPCADESPLPGEPPQPLAERLALAKARSVTHEFNQHLIIGSDQVASCQGIILGKPGTLDKAAQQLELQSGQRVLFHTTVVLLDSRDGSHQLHTDCTAAFFRHLSQEEIRRYLTQEQPFDCAGSFKVEGLGISLFERLEMSDPTALEGLPLIALAGMLRKKGYKIP